MFSTYLSRGLFKAGFYLKFVKIFHFLFLPNIATLGTLVYVRALQNVIFALFRGEFGYFIEHGFTLLIVAMETGLFSLGFRAILVIFC